MFAEIEVCRPDGECCGYRSLKFDEPLSTKRHNIAPEISIISNGNVIAYLRSIF